MLLHLFYRLQPSSRAYVSSAVSTTFFLTFSDRKPILRESRNCLGKSNPFSAIQFTLTHNLSYVHYYCSKCKLNLQRAGAVFTMAKRENRIERDAVIQQQSFHITIPLKLLQIVRQNPL